MYDDEIDSLWFDAVSEHSSTCDGCYEFMSNDLQEMDEETQLAYCQNCREKFFILRNKTTTY